MDLPSSFGTNARVLTRATLCSHLVRPRVPVASRRGLVPLLLSYLIGLQDLQRVLASAGVAETKLAVRRARDREAEDEMTTRTTPSSVGWPDPASCGFGLASIVSSSPAQVRIVPWNVSMAPYG